MRKACAFFLALLLLLSAGTVYAAKTAMAPATEVTFSREHLYGDPNAADGFTLRPVFSIGRSKIWTSDIKFTGDTLEASTNFQLCDLNEVQLITSDPFEGVSITTNAIGSREIFSDSAEGYLRFAKIKERFDSMEPGSYAALSVWLHDLYETYPLSLSVQMDKINYGYWEEQDIDSAGLSLENQNAILFMKYFPIPVPEAQFVNVMMVKNEDGSLGGFALDFNPEGSDYFEMENFSACKDSSAYFCFNNHTVLGNKVDTSGLPLGYGIYKLTVENEEQTLSLLCPLDENERIRHLTMDAEKNNLLLFAETEDKRFILHQIDVETGDTITDWEIGRFENPEAYDYMSFKEMDHCIILCIGKRAYILEPDPATGKWKCDFSPVVIDDGFYQSRIPWYRLDWPSTHKVEYDGEHLAISWYTYQMEHNESPDGMDNSYYAYRLSLGTCVYDKENIVYYGITHSTIEDAAKYRDDLSCIHPGYRID